MLPFNGTQFNLFKRPNESPSAVEAGDVLLLRSVKCSERQGKLQLVGYGSDNWTWAMLKLTGADATPMWSGDLVNTVEKQQMINMWKWWAGDKAGPSHTPIAKLVPAATLFTLVVQVRPLVALTRTAQQGG
jgi:hypothetical protein